MTNFVFVCTLNDIIYPGETKKLTIEDTTIQLLLKTCLEDDKSVGFAISIDGESKDYGTLVKVLKLKNSQHDDVLFVEVKGEKVFRILEMVDQLPDKPFKGAIVAYPENDTMKVKPNLAQLVIDEVKRLYTMLNIENMPLVNDPNWLSYDIAHKLGLTKEQEYEFLTIFNEIQRMEYLRRYFNAIMPEVQDLDLLKSRINLN